MKLPVHALIALGLTATGTGAVSAQSSAGTLRDEVIVAVAEAEGLTGDVPPAYAGELETARHTLETQFFCLSPPAPQSLPDDLLEKLVQATLKTLQDSGQGPVIAERPAYTSDVIATAIISFEYGRLLNFTSEQRTAVCTSGS